MYLTGYNDWCSTTMNVRLRRLAQLIGQARGFSWQSVCTRDALVLVCCSSACSTCCWTPCGPNNTCSWAIRSMRRGAPVNVLGYADDTSPISNSPPRCTKANRPITANARLVAHAQVQACQVSSGCLEAVSQPCAQPIHQSASPPRALIVRPTANSAWRENRLHRSRRAAFQVPGQVDIV